jgi:hypothetical protein
LLPADLVRRRRGAVEHLDVASQDAEVHRLGAAQRLVPAVVVDEHVDLERVRVVLALPLILRGARAWIAVPVVCWLSLPDVEYIDEPPRAGAAAAMPVLGAVVGMIWRGAAANPDEAGLRRFGFACWCSRWIGVALPSVINVRLDSSRGAKVRATVTGVHDAHLRRRLDRRSTPRWFETDSVSVRLPGPPPFTVQLESMWLGQPTLAVGDELDVRVHPGLLGYRYVDAGH